MSNLTANINSVCELITEKVRTGYGISSPQAALVEKKLAEFENELAALNIFPSDWTHKHSIGKGNLASVMWVVFLPPGQTTQDGIYVSFCFGKAGNGLVTGCAISNTSQKKYSYIPTVERPNPKIDVDGTRPGTHYNNGYVNPLEVYAGKVDEAKLKKHIVESIGKCQECLNMAKTKKVVNKSATADERYALWRRFLEKWPDTIIASLTLDDYTSFGGARDSFCNWIESRTQKLGSIWGGSAYKFGVFARDPRKQQIDDSTHGNNEKYGWYKCYGSSPEDVLKYVKDAFSKIIAAIKSGEMSKIDDIYFGHAIKWKIAFLYQSIDNPIMVPIYNKAMLHRLTGMPKNTATSVMQAKLMANKPIDQDLFDYYDDLLNNMPSADLESSEYDDEDDKDVPGEDALSIAFRSAPKKGRTGMRKLSAVVDNNDMLQRLMAALRTKPFAILAGHSGTGKSQLVRRLAYMTCNDEELFKEKDRSNAPGNYCMVQVKPNWHDSTDLLGYYTEMNGGKYHTTPFVEFICKAYAYPETPFFVCLDEMNLAPVEQYFAEYLSAIESMAEKENVWLTDRLIAEKADADEICGVTKFKESVEWVGKHGLTIPRNLFVVGTVNVDETTCQFSRKVLDRAMTILMTAVSFKSMSKANDPSTEECLDPAGINFFLDRPTQTVLVQGQMDKLDAIQRQVGDSPFAIAYRFANEYALYQSAYQILNGEGLKEDETPDPANEASQKRAIDHVVLMKLLPRIHGVRSEVEVLFNGDEGENKKDGLIKMLAEGQSVEMMKQILARPGEYLSFWP